MEMVLVSACLLGEKVRYNGADKRCDDPIMMGWVREGRAVSVCPEVLGGLPVPRPPAEITEAAGGLEVLNGRASVMGPAGENVSVQFRLGAEQALEMAQTRGIRMAVLKENSPSCGSRYTYDGSFSGTRVALPGVTAARLQEAGVRVFSEAQLGEAQEWLKRLEADGKE
jgi:uncharacterized protein YbbK (DUF523 family)